MRYQEESGNYNSHRNISAANSWRERLLGYSYIYTRTYSIILGPIIMGFAKYIARNNLLHSNCKCRMLQDSASHWQRPTAGGVGFEPFGCGFSSYFTILFVCTSVACWALSYWKTISNIGQSKGNIGVYVSLCSKPSKETRELIFKYVPQIPQINAASRWQNIATTSFTSHRFDLNDDILTDCQKD